MDMCLTGRMMDAVEAERAGLVSRVVPAAELIDEVMKVAERIADMSRPVAMLAKGAVNRAYAPTLAQGGRFERRLAPRPAERRGGKECGSTLRSRWEPDH